MIIKEKQAQITEIDTKLNNLQTQVKLFQAQKAKLIKELSQCIKDELNSLTPEKVMTMPHEVFSTEEGEDLLSNYMSKFHHITASNYWMKTGTQAARVAFSKSRPFQEHFEEINQFLPFCAEMMICTSNGQSFKVKVMKVLDPGGGKLGTLTLGLTEHGTLMLFKTVNSQIEAIHCFSDYRLGLEFLYEEYSFGDASAA